jgi:hypothetical protein
VASGALACYRGDCDLLGKACAAVAWAFVVQGQVPELQVSPLAARHIAPIYGQPGLHFKDFKMRRDGGGHNNFTLHCNLPDWPNS